MTQSPPRTVAGYLHIKILCASVWLSFRRESEVRKCVRIAMLSEFLVWFKFSVFIFAAFMGSWKFPLKCWPCTKSSDHSQIEMTEILPTFVLLSKKWSFYHSSDEIIIYDSCWTYGNTQHSYLTKCLSHQGYEKSCSLNFFLFHIDQQRHSLLTNCSTKELNQNKLGLSCLGEAIDLFLKSIQHILLKIISLTMLFFCFQGRN